MKLFKILLMSLTPLHMNHNLEKKGLSSEEKKLYINILNFLKRSMMVHGRNIMNLI